MGSTVGVRDIPFPDFFPYLFVVLLALHLYLIYTIYMDNEFQKYKLQLRQSLDLDTKILLTKRRIADAVSKYGESGMYISFSGGKDSTVLLHLVRSLYPSVPAVFADTGLEYPEIREFVSSLNNVTSLRPKMGFRDVLENYGIPVLSKEVSQKLHEIRTTNSDKLRNKRLYGDDKGNGAMPKKWRYMIEAPFKISHNCCNVMKKSPFKKYEKETGRVPFIGTMAQDSTMRKTSYYKTGCNSFETKRPVSMPIAFWMEADIWEYITRFELPYSEIYDKGYERTGCMFCMFGVHLDGQPNRFQRMKQTHPKQWKYCMDVLGLRKVMWYLELPCE